MVGTTGKLLLVTVEDSLLLSVELVWVVESIGEVEELLIEEPS